MKAFPCDVLPRDGLRVIPLPDGDTGCIQLLFYGSNAVLQPDTALKLAECLIKYARKWKSEDEG